jgi:hypothetical protein
MICSALRLTYIYNSIENPFLEERGGDRMIKFFLGRAEHLRDLLERYDPQSLLTEVIGEEMRGVAYRRSYDRKFGFTSDNKRRSQTMKHRG